MQDQEFPDFLEMKDEIIGAFHPIEQLFRIMDRISIETEGITPQACAQIGLELSKNFYAKINIIFDIYSPKDIT